MAVEDIRELSDGRFDIFRDGLCIHVAHSKEDAVKWWKETVAIHKDTTEAQGKALNRNLYR